MKYYLKFCIDCKRQGFIRKKSFRKYSIIDSALKGITKYNIVIYSFYRISNIKL